MSSVERPHGSVARVPSQPVSVPRVSHPLDRPPQFDPRFQAAIEVPPQSSFTLGPAPDLSASACLPGVLALFATSRKRVYSSQRFPSLCYVPSLGFLGPSTVCSALSLAGLFHPAAASRVHPRSGALTPRAAPPDSSPGGCPHAVGSQALTDPCGPMATPTSLDFEASFRARTRGSCRRVQLRPDSLPSSGSLSPPGIFQHRRCGLRRSFRS